MALSDPCKEREPRVIDNALIQKCIDLQFSKGEVGRLVREEGIPLDELEELRFEFMNILKIDHLWVLTALTKLQLNNNIIDKIENLETLVHLRELDLSFNKISKIENLEALVKLEKLSFFDNLIETIENMDKLKKLTVFSIGRNRVTDWANVHYLRKFKQLRSLNMARNPCAEEDDFRNFIAAFLPDLVYYEYRRIDDSEREEGMQTFEERLLNLQRIEVEENAIIERKEKEIADAELHSVSFVEYLNTRNLYDQMFEEDEEGITLLDLGDEVQEFYDEYEEHFIHLCKLIFDVGQKHYQIRKTEVDQFLQSVDGAKLESQNKSIDHMEEFLEKKEEIFEEVKDMQDKLDDEQITEEYYDEEIDKYADAFGNLIHETWKKLMKDELQLFEQVDEVNQNFGHTLNDLINSFLEEAQAIFAQIRALEVTYSENIGDAGGRFLTNLNLNEDMVVPESLEFIMSDRENLTNAVAASHDLHMQVIDNREDTLVNRARNYAEGFCTGLIKDEIKRNRYKILEINHYLDIQREEFNDLIAEDTIDLDDLDIFLSNDHE